MQIAAPGRLHSQTVLRDDALLTERFVHDHASLVSTHCFIHPICPRRDRRLPTSATTWGTRCESPASSGIRASRCSSPCIRGPTKRVGSARALYRCGCDCALGWGRRRKFGDGRKRVHRRAGPSRRYIHRRSGTRSNSCVHRGPRQLHLPLLSRCLGINRVAYARGQMAMNERRARSA